MKFLKSLLILSLAVIAFSSCEKVIDVKLNNADKKLVIDAQITNVAGTCKVIISRTKEFSSNNELDGVSGATIEILGDDGTVFSLADIGGGVYESDGATGLPGHTYELKITVEGKTYTATSTMPEFVTFDSLSVEKQKFFDEEQVFANVSFKDPVGGRNYYRFVQHVNDYKIPGYSLLDDDLSDGKDIRSTLYFFLDDDIEPVKSGDEFIVEMQGIDAAVYKYWFSLEQSASGSGNSAAPANPVSNIKGDALGYFSAHTRQVKTIIVP